MKIVAAILAVALLLVGSYAMRLLEEVKSGREQVAVLAAQLQQRRAAPVPLPQVPAPAPLAAAARVNPAGNAPETTEVAVEPVPPEQAPTLMDALRAQMSSPEGMARRRESNRQAIRSANPDVSEALGLAPEEAERFLELLVTQQERSFAIFENAREAGAPASSAAAEFEENRRNDESELQALLGSRYPQWQDYQQTRGVWQQRRDLRAVLDAAGTPLADAQGRSLIAALAAEQRSISQTRSAAAQPFAQYAPERRQRLLNAAAPHLSAQQLESYRQMLERAAMQERAMFGRFADSVAAGQAGAR